MTARSPGDEAAFTGLPPDGTLGFLHVETLHSWEYLFVILLWAGQRWDWGQWWRRWK